MTPTNDTDKTILGFLTLISETLGSEFDIPPKTAAAITTLRESQARMRLRVDDSLHQHLGWHILLPTLTPVVDTTLWHMLVTELAEIYETSMAALQLQMRSDPSFMRVRNGGPAPFFVDKNGKPTFDRSDAERTTPEYLRIAWAGGMDGLWEVEDVLSVPRIYGLTDEGAAHMMKFVKTSSGPEVTAA